MELLHSSWLEIEDYLKFSDGIIIPTGSIEQHGPIGLIGTDTLCASDIATEAAQKKRNPQHQVPRILTLTLTLTLKKGAVNATAPVKNMD